jgi:hypothetical protein
LKKFEDILAQCIEDIKAGRASIEDCLDRYPSLREQLEPLLRIALEIREPPDIKPSPASKLKARVQLMDQIHGGQAVTKQPWPRYNNQVKPITYRRRFDMTSLMKPKVWKLVVASFAVLFVAVAVYMVFFAAPRAVGSLVLQVNPGFNFTFDERNIVIEAKGTDAAGEALLAGLDVIGKEVTEANLVITRAMHKAGLLADGDRILIALYPFGDQNGEVEAQLTALAGAIYQTQTEYLAEHGLRVDVVSVALSAELADAVSVAGLLPIDYVDLVVEVGPQAVMEVLALQGELGLDPTLFKEEFSTMAAALIDMTEAGIDRGNALAILRGALVADPKMEELTTITAAMIDLHEAGATPENIMTVFKLMEEQVVAGLDRNLLLEEFSTIIAAKIDMLDAGITEDNALAILKSSLAADPTLDELTTITAAMIDLHEAGATPENIMTVFKLMEEQVVAGLDRNLLLEEFSTIIAAKIDMLDAGITEDNALAILKSSLAADPTLDELTTITAAMIDLHEVGATPENIMAVFILLEELVAAGVDQQLLLEEITTITAAMIDLVVEERLSPEEALARIRAAIEADPTLQDFDDLIDGEEVNDEEVKEVNDEEVNDEEVNDEEVNDEEVNDEEVNDEEVNDEEVNAAN